MPANQITRYNPAPAAVVVVDDATATETARIGGQADAARAAAAFADYLETQKKNTKRAIRIDLAAFAAYLAAAGHRNPPDAKTLETTPAAWRGITAGLIDGFKRWTIAKGYAISTANRRLATVKTFARLAADAGAIDEIDALKIARVKGYSASTGAQVDEQRKEQEIATRKGAKKVESNKLEKDQRRALKEAAAETDADGNPTPRGRRDALLVALALDQGLRIGEIVILTRRSFNLEEGTLDARRPKVGKQQFLPLAPDTIRAFVAYVAAGDAPDDDSAPLLRRSRKKGSALTDRPLDERSAAERIALLGRQIGIANLSPHDLRHTWATFHSGRASKGEISLFDLQEAGGWNSLAMPRRYTDKERIVNRNMAISL